VLLLHNSAKTREIIEAWDNVPYQNPYYAYLAPQKDQCAFNEVILPRYKANIKVLQHPECLCMNGHSGVFIRHMAGLSTEQRLNYLKEVMKHLHIVQLKK
jgi:hypothetical protein